MKKYYYLLAFLVSITCAIICIVSAVNTPVYSSDFSVLILMITITMAAALMFGYALYSTIKENYLFDKTAKEQKERDWDYYERMCESEIHRYFPETQHR